ncbi:MAG: hypothetical protein ACLFTT_17295 [Candidatus Hydrogenedentota bacterium]
MNWLRQAVRGARWRTTVAGAAVSLGAALAVAGCEGRIAPESPPAPHAERPGETQDAGGAMSMQGINLYLHEAKPSAGAPRNPTFRLHAERFAMLEDDVWSVQNAQALLYGDAPDDEAVTIEAARGRFEEAWGATLEGGVTAYVNDIVIKLQNLEWVNPQQENEQGVARSDKPLTLDGPTATLEAASIRLYPDARRFVLTDVSGRIHLDRRSEP